MKKAKSKITRTQIKKILSDLAFDPNQAPMKFAAETDNPIYSFSRAKEIIYEIDTKNDNPVAELQQAMKFLTLTIALLETSNGAKTAQK